MGDGGAIRRPDATRDSALNNPIRGAKSARWASPGAFFRGRHESTEIAAFEGQPLAERAARNKWREGIEGKQDKKGRKKNCNSRKNPEETVTENNSLLPNREEDKKRGRGEGNIREQREGFWGEGLRRRARRSRENGSRAGPAVITDPQPSVKAPSAAGHKYNDRCRVFGYESDARVLAWRSILSPSGACEKGSSFI